jgi:hypothetical protein
MEWIRDRDNVGTGAQNECIIRMLRPLTGESYDGLGMYFLWGKENINNNVFWDVTPCRAGGSSRNFGGAYCLHLQYSGVIYCHV